MYFKYSEKEVQYLKGKCKKLASVIDCVGKVNREIDKDLFSAVVHHIVAQQISSKALQTVWGRLEQGIGVINAESVINCGVEKLQSFGISFKKADYIMDFANKVKSGELDIDSLWQKEDEEIIKELSQLRGIGVWTAEMLLLFCMERKNVFSYNDLGIQRGLKMLYHHRNITKPLFEKYRKKFSPYCSLASLYLWEVSGGKYNPDEHK